jgi:hypothetical protein
MFAPAPAMQAMNAQAMEPTAEVYPIPRLPVPAAEPPPRLARGQAEEAHDPLPVPLSTPAEVPVPVTPVTAVVVARVSMPSPGDLGVNPAADWTVTLSRLEAMGLGAFQLQEVPQGGGWVFVGQMRTAQPGHSQRITTTPAATRGAALRLALLEVERSR